MYNSHSFTSKSSCRFDRAIKTIKDLMKHASEGKEIVADDIPPALPGSFLVLGQDSANQLENRNSGFPSLPSNQHDLINLEPIAQAPPPIPLRPDKVPPSLPPPIQPRSSEPTRGSCIIHNLTLGKLFKLFQ